MTSLSILKSAAIGGVTLVAALAVTAGALRWAIDEADVRAAITQSIGKAAAADLAFGATRIEFWPRPAAVVEDLAVGSGPVGLTAPRVRAVLQVLPLAVGRVAFEEIRLERPSFEVRADASLAPAASPATELLPRPQVRIAGGTVSLRRSDGSVERFEDITATASWSGSALTLAGRFRLRGQPADAQVVVGNMDALARGQRSPARLRLTAPVLRASLEGQALVSRGLQLEGALAAESSSLRAVLAWFDADATLSGGLGRFALKGQAVASPSQVALSQASVELDGNKAEGSLAVRFDGDRPTLLGTLASEVLTLTPYLSDLSLGGANWSRAPFNVGGLGAADADLRLSAGRIVIGPVTIGRTGGTVLARNGRVTVTLGEAQVFAGTLRGAVTLAPGRPGAQVRIDAVAQDIDLDRASTELFGVRRLEGRAGWSLNLEAKGETLAELAQTVSGSLRASAAAGALAGINVEQVLRRIERRPLLGIGDPRGGRTPFDRLALQVRFAQGTATCEDVRLESPAVRIGVAGSASLVERAFELRGTATLVRSTGAFELPFFVRGPWTDPALLPDTESLIRRSGAAAPLLEALRDRVPAPRETPRAAAEPSPQAQPGAPAEQAP